MPLLNFPLNTIPPAFTHALAKAEQAQRLVAGPAQYMRAMAEAIKLLSESNQLLISVLTDGQVR